MDLLTLLVVVLLVLWIAGYAMVPAAGSLIHVLLVIAVVLFILRLLSGRKIL